MGLRTIIKRRGEGRKEGGEIKPIYVMRRVLGLQRAWDGFGEEVYV
jgi:hypothetical protein